MFLLDSALQSPDFPLNLIGFPKRGAWCSLFNLVKRIPYRIILLLLVFSAGCSWLFPETKEEDGQSVVSAQRASVLPASKGHTDEVLMIVPLADGRSFVTAAKDGQLLLWTGNPPSARQLYQHRTPIDLAAFDPIRKQFAVSSKGVIYVIDLEAGEVRYKLDRIKARHLDLQFSPDGRDLYFGATDDNVYRWKFIDERRAQSIQDKEKAFERYNGPAQPVNQVAVHLNGRIFFTGDWSGTIWGWMTYDSDRNAGYFDTNMFGPEFFSEGATRVKFSHRDNIAIDQLKLSPDGSLLFSALRTGELELYKVRGAKKSAVLQDHTRDVFSIAVAPDQEHVVTAGRDELIHIVKVHRETEAELKAKPDRSYDYDLTIERDFHLPDIRVVAFQNNSSIIAGAQSGTIFEVPLDQMNLLPTPEPTPTHTPRPKDAE